MGVLCLVGLPVLLLLYFFCTEPKRYIGKVKGEKLYLLIDGFKLAGVDYTGIHLWQDRRVIYYGANYAYILEESNIFVVVHVHHEWDYFLGTDCSTYREERACQ